MACVIDESLFRLANLNGIENSWDFSKSYTGDLYYDDVFVTAFYEHPVEGGYYQNGTIGNSELYRAFLSVSEERPDDRYMDEQTVFDKRITDLMSCLQLD